MSAAEVLEHARMFGLVVRAGRETLLVSGVAEPPAELLERLKAHKVEILAALRRTAIDPGDAANINAWLDSIGEHDPAERAAVFARCAESPDTCALVVGVAVGALLGWDTHGGESPDVRRTCRTCVELAPSGLCRAAMRGAIPSVASTW